MKTITTKDAENMLKTPGVVVLDVRAPKEYVDGHIAGAVNIDVNDPMFNENVKKLDHNASYIVYCLAGVRGGRATTQMTELGFTDAKNLEGGISVWRENGLPVEK